jgi:hypothetical protein
MMLSPLPKLDIAWKAECLDDDSLEFIDKERLRARGDVSIAVFKFTSDIAVA